MPAVGFLGGRQLASKPLLVRDRICRGHCRPEQRRWDRIQTITGVWREPYTIRSDIAPDNYWQKSVLLPVLANLAGLTLPHQFYGLCLLAILLGALYLAGRLRDPSDPGPLAGPLHPDGVQPAHHRHALLARYAGLHRFHAHGSRPLHQVGSGPICRLPAGSPEPPCHPLRGCRCDGAEGGELGERCRAAPLPSMHPGFTLVPLGVKLFHLAFGIEAMSRLDFVLMEAAGRVAADERLACRDAHLLTARVPVASAGHSDRDALPTRQALCPRPRDADVGVRRHHLLH